MALLTQQQLVVESNLTYIDNTTGSITPQAVRNFNYDFISSSITADLTSSMSVKYAATASLLLGSVQSASFAQNAATASYLTGTVTSASYALNSTNASTASYYGGSVVSASYASTASYVNGLNSASYTPNAIVTASAVNTTITFTKGDNTTFAVVLSQSGSVASASYAVSASYSNNATSASYALSSSYAVNASQLNGQAASTYATTGSNTFTGINNFNIISASFAKVVSASIDYLSVVYQTSSVIFSSGSNIFGDNADDTQTLWGTVNVVTGPLLVSGSVNVTGSLNMANGAEIITSRIKSLSSAGLIISSSASLPITRLGAGGGQQAEFFGQVSAVTFVGTGSGIVGVVSSSYALTASAVTGTVASASYALNADTASSVNSLNQNVLVTGSVNISGSLTVSTTGVEFQVLPSGITMGNTLTDVHSITGSLNVTGSSLLNGSATLRPQYVATEYPFTVNQTADATAANANIISNRNTGIGTTGSFTVSGSNNVLLLGTGVPNASILQGAVFGFSGRANIVSNANISVSGSNTSRVLPTSNNTILGSTVAVQDDRPSATTTPLTLTNSNINSIVNLTTTTGSVTFTNVTVSGLSAFNVTGSVGATKTIVSSLFNGASNTINIDSPTTVALANGLLVGGVTNTLLSSGSNYNFIATNIFGTGLSVTGSTTLGGNTFVGRYNAQDSTAILSNTVFGIGTGTASGSRKTSFFVSSSGLTTLRDSLEITGSVNAFVVSASIASNTSSLDFSTGNFYTSLVTGTTNFNITNPKAGQTVNLLLTTAGTGASASFSSNVRQVSGSVYTPTPTAGAKDILTFISWDGTSVYLANVKNLI